MGGRPTVLTDEHKEIILNEYMDKTYSKLAEELGIKTPKVIEQFLRAKGIYKQKRKRVTPQQKQFMIDHIDTLTYREIAERTGIPATTVGKYGAKYRKVKGNEGRIVKNEIYDLKTEFAKTKDYDTLGKAIIGMGKYTFEEQYQEWLKKRK